MTVRVALGQRGDAVALVDEADAPLLRNQRWILAGGYAVESGRRRDGRSAAMHRQILGLASGDPRAVHHVNEDKLDNRRTNLVVFETVSEANSQPHPARDEAGREGFRRYQERRAGATA